MDVTELLRAANEGNEDALESLAPMVYDELRWLAHSQLQQEFGPRTLSTTALVNEAYMLMATMSQGILRPARKKSLSDRRASR